MRRARARRGGGSGRPCRRARTRTPPGSGRARPTAGARARSAGASRTPRPTGSRRSAAVRRAPAARRARRRGTRAARRAAGSTRGGRRCMREVVAEQPEAVVESLVARRPGTPRTRRSAALRDVSHRRNRGSRWRCADHLTRCPIPPVRATLRISRATRESWSARSGWHGHLRVVDAAVAVEDDLVEEAPGRGGQVAVHHPDGLVGDHLVLDDVRDVGRGDEPLLEAVDLVGHGLQLDLDDHAEEPVTADRRAEELGVGVAADAAHRAVGGDQEERTDGRGEVTRSGSRRRARSPRRCRPR